MAFTAIPNTKLMGANLKKQIWIATLGAAALILSACSSEPPVEDESTEPADVSLAENDEQPLEAEDAELVVINVDDLYDALLLREDKNGKTDISYKMDLSRGALIQFENAFFYAMATGGVDWEVKFSTKQDGRTSIINCALIEREEKEVFVNNDAKRLMTVIGTVQYIDGDTVFLEDCQFREN